MVAEDVKKKREKRKQRKFAVERRKVSTVVEWVFFFPFLFFSAEGLVE